jgi:hypothetical protein
MPPVVTPQAAAQPPERKMRGCLIAIGIALALVVVGGIGLALVAQNATEARDLEVAYTEADYWSALDKAGIEVSEVPEGEDWANTDTVYSGSKPLDAVFTPAEVSALANYSHASGWPLKGVQLSFFGTDGLEFSASVTYQGVDYPVYAKATAGVSGRTVSGSLMEAEVLGQSVPAQYYAAGESFALAFINARTARVEGLDITLAEVVDGGVHLVGTVPERVERVPR